MGTFYEKNNNEHISYAHDVSFSNKNFYSDKGSENVDKIPFF